jgi:hypothetical protein
VGSDEDAGETGDESSTAADGSWLVLAARGPEVEENFKKGTLLLIEMVNLRKMLRSSNLSGGQGFIFFERNRELY